MADCQNCPNHALLTVDTNVLCYLARFCYGAGGFAIDGSPAEVIAGFSPRFEDMLYGVCKCSPDKNGDHIRAP